MRAENHTTADTKQLLLIDMYLDWLSRKYTKILLTNVQHVAKANNFYMSDPEIMVCHLPPLLSSIPLSTVNGVLFFFLHVSVKS